MSTTEAPDGQRTLDHYANPEQCQAIAEYSGEQCQSDALSGVAYCYQHFG